MSSPGDDREQRETFREGVGPADPEPVTDAMVSPRSAPRPAEPGGPVCHVCGEHNHLSATYCLQCGSQLRAPEPATSPDDGVALDYVGEAADEGWWDPDSDDGPMRRPFGDTTPDGEAEVSYAAAGRARDPRETIRIALWGLLGLVAVVIVLLTFLGGGEDAVPETSTTLVGGIEAEMYGSLIGELADDVVSLGDQATLINQRWEDQQADFQETLAALESLASDMGDISSRLGLQTPPAGLSPESHNRLVSSAATLQRAANNMVEGLKAPDTGEQRRAALSTFTAASAEFRAVADTLLQLIDLTGGSSA